MALNDFRREVAILKACRDPNIVAFLVGWAVEPWDVRLAAALAGGVPCLRHALPALLCASLLAKRTYRCCPICLCFFRAPACGTTVRCWSQSIARCAKGDLAGLLAQCGCVEHCLSLGVRRVGSRRLLLIAHSVLTLLASLRPTAGRQPGAQHCGGQGVLVPPWPQGEPG